MGCEELGETGLKGTGKCCEVCHSAADGFALDDAVPLGPCHAVLADGRWSWYVARQESGCAARVREGRNLGVYWVGVRREDPDDW